MTKRIYWQDIIKCEEQLFESLDALVQIATETTSIFISYFDSESEVESVEITEEGLEIWFTTLDEYDEDDNPVMKSQAETFPIEYLEMGTLVG